MMLSKQNNRVLSGYIRIVAGALLLGAVFAPRISPAATVNELIAKAKQEGVLNATVTSSLTGRTTPLLIAAFKKRFGLDIAITLTPVGDTENYPRAVAEAKAGTVPTYDSIEGSEVENISLLGVGGIQQIDNWRSLLAEVNPLVRSGKVRPEVLSPAVLSGYGFAHHIRVKGILYNPKLISLKDLPRTHAELVDPKYKGKWCQPPWTTHWDIGPMVFPDMDKEKWLEIVRNAGKNAGTVQVENNCVQRVLLGEFAFTLANTYYAFAARAKDAKASLEITYFKDYNLMTAPYYIVRKGARRPAAATLFALWMTTPESEAIWQPELFASQFLWGESELDKREKQFIQDSGAKVVDLLTTDKGRDLLAWYGTEEGRRYRQAIGKAIRGE